MAHRYELWRNDIRPQRLVHVAPERRNMHDRVVHRDAARHHQQVYGLIAAEVDATLGDTCDFQLSRREPGRDQLVASAGGVAGVEAVPAKQRASVCSNGQRAPGDAVLRPQSAGCDRNQQASSHRAAGCNGQSAETCSVQFDRPHLRPQCHLIVEGIRAIVCGVAAAEFSPVRRIGASNERGRACGENKETVAHGCVDSASSSASLNVTAKRPHIREGAPSTVPGSSCQRNDSYIAE